ncbi:Outer spore wall protein RRT8 [Candida viswanathii]|uniref:Outer spore wall protein RRT8 n=1 Tax=Candida viswanathii TaxID=5486 RepID=A0A367YKE3_9ASCO|nr:Outer spore wall protein RRT8 [Candida viswanathii]
MTIPIISIIKSRAYIYPFKGLIYFFMHPAIWPFYITILIPQLTLTLIIYSVMFATFFPPQAVIYTLLMGPLGVIGAWYNLILQASTLSIFIVIISLMPHIQRVAYDAVLVRECSEDVVLMGKLRRYKKLPIRVRVSEYLKAMSDLSIFPFLLIKLLVFGLIYFIPFVGPIIVLLFQSSRRGVKAHGRYFKLRGFLRSDIREIHKLNRPAYMGYGIVALWLELFPFANMFFMFTNTLGAALWAVDIERNEKATAEKNAIEMQQLTGLLEKRIQLSSNDNHQGAQLVTILSQPPEANQEITKEENTHQENANV